MAAIASIDNPILNSLCREPTRHFRFDANNQTTSVIDEGRRGSSYFLPIAAPKKKGAPGLFDAFEEKKEESGHVNRIRQLVKNWREMGWPDITPMTCSLLEHWHAEDRLWALFFCQLEALETLIYVTEVAKQTKYGEVWIEKYLREKADDAGTELFRVACKMATDDGLYYGRYIDDFPAFPLNNSWMDTGVSGFASDRHYEVQTNTKIIERCLLMTTDSGDLVLDPTCGSGTTAYVAEQWGRRWITIDTSRVALALARTRLMAARFPYYLLADSWPFTGVVAPAIA